MKLGHGPFDPHEPSNKTEEQRGKMLQSLYCRCDSEKKTQREGREEERERIKGKEDVVKTQAPKRLI